MYHWIEGLHPKSRSYIEKHLDLFRKSMIKFPNISTSPLLFVEKYKLAEPTEVELVEDLRFCWNYIETHNLDFDLEGLESVTTRISISFLQALKGGRIEEIDEYLEWLNRFISILNDPTG